MVYSDDPDKTFYEMDTIAYEGQLWLVPEWIDIPAGGWRIPARIVCLDRMSYDRVPPDFLDLLRVHYVLNDCKPRDLFFGQIQTEVAIDLLIKERPDIRFPAIGG